MGNSVCQKCIVILKAGNFLETIKWLDLELFTSRILYSEYRNMNTYYALKLNESFLIIKSPINGQIHMWEKFLEITTTFLKCISLYFI